MSLKNKFFIILLTNLISVNIDLYGQKTLVTEIGVVVYFDKDGSLKVSESYTNPYENPNFNFLLDNEDKQKLDKITKDFQEKDLNYFGRRIFLNKEILSNQSALQSANLAKNNAEVKKLNAEQNDLNNLKKSNEANYSKLKTDFDSFNKVYTFKSKKDISNLINNYSKKLITANNNPITNEGKHQKDIEKVTTQNSRKTNSNLNDNQTIDHRRPWEINKQYEDNLFILHTPSNLKDYYKDDHFIKGFAQIEKEDKDFVLNLELRFSSSDVQKSYGFIKEGDFLKINFIYGHSMFLTAKDNIIGKIENNTGNTIFKAKYKFKNKSDVKKISKSHIDSIGILWSSGFEYYPVYKLDLLINQFQALN
jgi:hypothetical protein